CAKLAKLREHFAVDWPGQLAFHALKGLLGKLRKLLDRAAQLRDEIFERASIALELSELLVAALELGLQLRERLRTLTTGIRKQLHVALVLGFEAFQARDFGRNVLAQEREMFEVIVDALDSLRAGAGKIS